MRRWLFALFVLGIVGSSAQVPTFSHAQSARDVDPAVTPSYIIGSCTLNGAEHEIAEGYFHCGAVQLFFPDESIAALRLRGEVGQRGELIWRRSQSK